MRVVAFYTRNTAYENEAALLRGSLDRAGMEHHMVPVPDRGSWDDNTRRKAHFLRETRQLLSGPLLYLDVDAFVHTDCAAYFDRLGEQGYDFGAHYFAGPAKGYDRSKIRPDGWRLLSGTLFLGDTIPCRNLLEVWCRLNDACQGVGWGSGGGQRNLWALVTSQARWLKVARLPGRYCYVFDKAWAYPEAEPCIIEHTMASRANRCPTKANRQRVKEREQRKRELARTLVAECPS